MTRAGRSGIAGGPLIQEVTMALGSDGECPMTFDAEGVAQLSDGTQMLLQVRFTLTELSPEDPRRAGDGFVHGRPCPCLLGAHLQMAHALAAGLLEEM